MSLITQLRRAHLDQFVDIKSAHGLELGPYNQPMVMKSEGNIKYLDFLTKEQLLALNGPEHLQEAIPETDYVVSDIHYADHVKEKFDYVIANHVGEHAPNFIKFFHDLSNLLKPMGTLFVALPDKKFTFDKYRTDTALSHFLYEYYQNVDEISKEHLLEVELYYDLDFIGKTMELEDRLSYKRLLQSLEVKPHIGVHCHVFSSETMLSKVIYPLIYMKLITLRLIKFVPAKAEHGGEMIAVFSKQESDTLPFTAADFYSTEFSDFKVGEQHFAHETVLISQKQDLGADKTVWHRLKEGFKKK